ncbi:hypothetical protein HUG10_04250 [Halorarum halophilum]|uniref:Uncharacterized protein n=1 Tax=Halorarum halophilum TaxID=2743090 RepID=A0A7D5KU12_9EURY|nr:hypothetical protein [Halobaculum halophilum]QLG26800.1 hypothetical protein HUG10_04250 [Halobaculum halophilum]
MTGPRTTRRGALALAGAVALAGCSDLELLGTGGPTLDGSAVSTAVDGPDPRVPETFPVRLEETQLSGSSDRARDLLEDVPTPLGPDEVPNGVVREHMSREAERAAEQLRRADDAASARERLTAARYARKSAMTVSAAWRATDGTLTRGDVEAEAGGLRGDLSDLRDRVRYVGDDPVRATVVHAALEGFLRRAASHLERPDHRHRESDGVLGVGELAGRHEQVRALVGDAEHLYGRFLDSLDERRELGDRLERAATESTEELRSAAADRSIARDREVSDYVDRDVEDTPARWALDDLADDLSFHLWEQEAVADRPARALVAAVDGFAALGAFDAVRNDVSEGELYEVEDAGDVRIRRRDAVTALRSAVDSPTEPALAAEVLPALGNLVAHGDEQLSRLDGEVSAEYVSRPVAQYVIAAEKAWGLQDGTVRVADRLRR